MSRRLKNKSKKKKSGLLKKSRSWKVNCRYSKTLGKITARKCLAAWMTSLRV
jgi:hypothetical protein